MGVARKRRVAVANVEDGSDPQPAPNPKRPRRRQKEYVPTYRSGAYGILIALWEAGDDMLTEEQLKELAQAHADASYTAPPHTTSFWTAWGAMKTLIEKELVYTRGVPQRFWLTETGKEVARAILAGREPAACVAEGSGGNGEASGSSSRTPPGVPSGAAAVTNRLLENQAPQILSGGGLHIGGEDFEEEARLWAVAKVEESRQRSRKPPGLGEDVIRNTDRPQALYSGRPAEYGMEPRPTLKQEKKPQIEFVDLENHTDFPPPPLRPPVLGVIAGNPNIQSSPYAPPRSSSLNVPSPTRPVPCKVSPLPTTREASTLHQQAQLKPAQTPPQSRQSGSPIFPAFTPEVLTAGTFTIHLLLDNREVRALNDRDYIATNLENAGVTPIIKALKVGDVMWVARENGPAGREVVLDHIVERKRLDDLLFSVRDGRFHDQKFRLKKSGMKNVTYIIEDLTMGVLDAQTQEIIETAISSTQVVDGFFVKKTSKLDETIQYLVRMTKMLQKLYQVPNTTHELPHTALSP
jgi:crossover junction endonuclease MUS81